MGTALYDHEICDDDANPWLICELCIVLNHRWEPGATFLLFTAYFDESDTHGTAPNLTMAAFLGSARQWELFGRKIRELQRRDGFRVFHAKDFRARTGEFHGWSQPKCDRLLNDLAVAIRDGLTEGVTVTLPRALYEREYRAPPVPKGLRLDSQYGVCFRLCLYMLIRRLIADKQRHKLHVVIESGHKNVRDTDRIFNEIKMAHEASGSKILGTITIAKKSECAELMIADFQAHASYLSEARMKIGLPGYFEMTKGEMPKHGEAGLTMMEITSETLQNLKAVWEERKQHRIAEWRAARDAKRAFSRSSPT
jgi:hypothetical protein